MTNDIAVLNHSYNFKILLSKFFRDCTALVWILEKFKV